MIDIGVRFGDADAARLRHPAVGGAILFARNFRDAAQLRRLTAEIRKAAGRPIVIAADQEGGRVQRFCGGGFTRLPAARALGDIAAADGEEACRQASAAAGFVMASELRAAGVDLSFAPVLDLAGKSAVIGNRAFAASPARVAACAAAFADGMAAAGMRCCGKHYPGHGGAAADSHITLPVDRRGFDALAAADLMPFASFAGRAALMTAHVVYPRVDAAAATFSAKWLGAILRGRLKFRGLVISDDLAMAGAALGGGRSFRRRIAAARAAGCDLFLFCAAARNSASGLWRGLDGLAGGGENPWLRLAPGPAKKRAARFAAGLKYLRDHELIG